MPGQKVMQMNKQYQVTVNKYYDKELSNPVIEMTVSQELATLLNNFACKPDMRATNYLRTLDSVENSQGNYPRPEQFYQRYLVRTSLMNTLNNSSGWLDIYALLFTKEILEDKMIKVPLQYSQVFEDIQQTVGKIKFLIKAAEEILTDSKINVTFKMED